MWEPLIVTGSIAAIATLVSVALYKRSKSHVQYKWARFSGAAAIAVVAFLGMTNFYLELTDKRTIQGREAVERFHSIRNKYNLCLEQEETFACRDPATEMRDVCSELLAPNAVTQ